MSLSKQDDWRRLPVEGREILLSALRQRATARADSYLSRIELAQRCGFDLDPWQKNFLLSDDKQVILNCARQVGKTSTTSLIALHQTLFTADSLTLVLSPSLRQSQECYRKIREHYNSLTGVPEVTLESALKLETANGSRVVVLPGQETTIRGYSGASLLIIDEAARVPDELYQAVRPMVAVSGGRVILLSTPFGSRGFFWQEWTQGGDDWLRVMVKASECPRIDPEWLKKERERIGSWWASQEYDCMFVDSLESVFATADIEASITSEVQPLWRSGTTLTA